jgi:hypothetical protein
MIYYFKIQNIRRFIMKRFAVLSLIFIAALILGCAGMEKAFSVKYEVISTCSSVDITYFNSSGVSTDTTVTIFPWKDEQTRTTPFDVYLITANGVGGTITSNIYVGGTLYKTETGSPGTTAITGTILKNH